MEEKISYRNQEQPKKTKKSYQMSETAKALIGDMIGVERDPSMIGKTREQRLKEIAQRNEEYMKKLGYNIEGNLYVKD